MHNHKVAHGLLRPTFKEYVRVGSPLIFFTVGVLICIATTSGFPSPGEGVGISR